MDESASAGGGVTSPVAQSGFIAQSARAFVRPQPLLFNMSARMPILGTEVAHTTAIVFPARRQLLPRRQRPTHDEFGGRWD